MTIYWSADSNLVFAVKVKLLKLTLGTLGGLTLNNIDFKTDLKLDHNPDHSPYKLGKSALGGIDDAVE